MPQIWRALCGPQAGRAAARRAVRDALGLAPGHLGDVPELAPLADQPPKPAPPPAVVILMPVHNAFVETKAALDALLRHTEVPWHLVLVEDASTEASVRPYLRVWSQQVNLGRAKSLASGRVTLLENPRNLGFVGAVNRGLRAARRQAQVLRSPAVVLLNSDALMPRGWASRLLAPLAARTDVASVTPLSNNAEILSVPAMCQSQQMPQDMASALDDCAQNLPAGPAVALPTGVGFCMAMSCEFLARIPQLDCAFGRGYGEEVDWCQRAAALGGVHLAAQTLFVSHAGGASFEPAEKAAALARAGQILQQRYPGFDTAVQQFLRRDPLARPRITLALRWAAETVAARGSGALPIYLAHALGGGAEMDLQRRIGQHVAQNGAAVVVRVGTARAWQIEVHGAFGACRAATDDLRLIRRLLAEAPNRRLIYSCGVGAADVAALPRALLSLRGAGGLGVLIHDYLPLSPSYTLLGPDGWYRGVPADESGDRAQGCGALQPDEWRAAWGALLTAADAIDVFSENSRAIVSQAYPHIADRLRVVPHVPLQHMPRCPTPGPGQPRRVAVLGNINHQKGAALLPALYKGLRAAGVGLVVIGQVDPAQRLPRRLRVHGAYDQAEVPDLVRRYGITDWVIPSIWPETFSFTTHEALATGLPTYAFDLGAQGDAVRAIWGTEHVAELGGHVTEAAANLQRVILSASQETARDTMCQRSGYVRA
ncbi:glycosyltransferase [Cognatishimia sp. SS12]|uniref:glycosyltransferase n=1 Tax=Cognatishimia sp. SS12 TaxID=2979465 RepID=UPI0023313E14|nr:glycosyltransferase [Cognatishimia sp. SS12]